MVSTSQKTNDQRSVVMPTEPKRVRRRFLLLTGALCAMTVPAAVIEQREIQVEQVRVTGGKGSMYPLVGVVKKGERLAVLEKQTDGWLRVQLNDQEGYCWAKSLEPPPNGGLLAGLDASKLTGNRSDPNASSVTASAAAKGLEKGLGEGTRMYAQTNSLSIDGLTEMIEARDDVAGIRFQLFAREGHVG